MDWHIKVSEVIKNSDIMHPFIKMDFVLKNKALINRFNKEINNFANYIKKLSTVILRV